MNIERSYTGIGTKENSGYLTLLIFPYEKSSFSVYDHKTQEETKILVDKSSSKIKVNIAGKKIKHILKLQLKAKPGKVTLDNKTLTEGVDYWFEKEGMKLIIKTDNYLECKYVID